MDYTAKTVRSRPGLTATEALVSLQEAPFFRSGTKIAAFDERAGRWIAQLQIPKTAGPFPPGGDEEGPDESAPPKPPGESDDSSSEDGPPSDSDSDSESSDGEGGEKKPKADKPGSDAQVVQLLTQILHALGGGDPMGGMGGPDDLGPGADGPPAPPPHGGPAGGPGAAPPPPKGPAGMGAGRPIKPGEVPNKPGVTPIGSPAFSSRQANPLPMGGMGAPGGGPMSPGPNPMTPGAGAPTPGPTSQGGTGSCAHCGGPLGPDGKCPTCGGSYTAGLREHIAKIAGRSASATVTCPPEVRSVKQAKALIESAAAPHGYKIKQIKRQADGRLAALLSVR